MAEDRKREQEIIEKYRRTGRTTRWVDQSVQELFKDGETILSDHYGTIEANEHMATIFRDRMEREHRGVNVKYKKHKDAIIATLVK